MAAEPDVARFSSSDRAGLRQTCEAENSAFLVISTRVLNYYFTRMSSPKSERLLRAAIVLLTFAFVFVIANRLHERIVTVGDSAPEFSIKADNGRTISASNFGANLLVLNSWATSCPPCVQGLPSV